MIYSDFLVLKFFRDIVVYEKITLIKKNFVPPFNTAFQCLQARTLTPYITLEVLSVSKHL